MATVSELESIINTSNNQISQYESHKNEITSFLTDCIQCVSYLNKTSGLLKQGLLDSYESSSIAIKIDEIVKDINAGVSSIDGYVGSINSKIDALKATISNCQSEINNLQKGENV